MPGLAEIKPYGKDGFVAFTPLGIRQCYAQDVPKEEAAVIYAIQGPIAARCFDDKISTAAWHTKTLLVHRGIRRPRDPVSGSERLCQADEGDNADSDK